MQTKSASSYNVMALRPQMSCPPTPTPRYQKTGRQLYSMLYYSSRLGVSCSRACSRVVLDRKSCSRVCACAQLRSRKRNTSMSMLRLSLSIFQDTALAHLSIGMMLQSAQRLPRTMESIIDVSPNIWWTVTSLDGAASCGYHNDIVMIHEFGI